MSYGESILYFMQKYTYIKIFRFVFFFGRYTIIFQTTDFSISILNKKKITITIRKNGFIALLQIILYMMH